MLKAYVVCYKSRQGRGDAHMVDVYFAASSEKAHDWGTREEAQRECKMLESLHRIEIPSTDGRAHLCKGFQVQESELGEFLVFCEIPFALRQVRSEDYETADSF
jgi:hypothetical protein